MTGAESARLRWMELADVRTVLDDLNAAQAPTLAQRVMDTIEHYSMVTDVVIFDAGKVEHSLRAQIRYWKELALLAASERAS